MTHAPHQPMLDHPSLDAERAANAFNVLGALASELAAALGHANSQYQWFLDLASWLLNRARELRCPASPGTALTAPAALRLVM